MARYPLETLLRPPVEWASALAAFSSAALALAAPQALLLSPALAQHAAAVFVAFGLWRTHQGLRVLRYQRGLRRRRAYTLARSRIRPDPKGLFLGRGFRWSAQHTQRLWDATRAHNRRYVQSSRSGHTQTERGLIALHGVGGPQAYRSIHQPANERQGHLFYLGTTGMGKTRAAELAMIQDIRGGFPTFCFDPKGDPDLFRTLFAEAQSADRPFYFFHLGYPEHSARYNPIGRFSRLTEVATRIAHQLPAQGNAEAFRQFAWLFSHIIAQALVALGERPDLRKILQHMNHIEPLLIRYFEAWLDQHGPSNWREAVQQAKPKKPERHLQSRDPRALQLVRYYRDQELYDPVADGLRRAFDYEKTFFDKISVAVQPLLEKLLAGRVGELLNPDYWDTQDPRPILDWQSALRQRAIVYCGLDALTDAEVAGVVGQSLIADLVSLAGEIYKHGLGAHLPVDEPVPPCRVHLDEFAELVRGPEIIQALNKGRGAGLRFSVYTQTLADLPAGVGDTAAQQIIGNVSNTLIVFAVGDLDTARLLTDRLGTVEVNALMSVTSATDSSSPDSEIHFTSSSQDRISTQTTGLLDPSAVLQLPRGEAFVLMNGAQLYKLQIPLLTGRAPLPTDLEAIAADMAQRYAPGARPGFDSG